MDYWQENIKNMNNDEPFGLYRLEDLKWDSGGTINHTKIRQRGNALPPDGRGAHATHLALLLGKDDSRSLLRHRHLRGHHARDLARTHP